LIGHLDTVFEKQGAFQRFERRGREAAGPGVNDMKGGDVAILYALKALHRANLLKDMRIIVAFTGDEESVGDPSSVSRRDLIEAAKRSDLALGYETAMSLDTAAIARRGVTGWTLEVTGTQAHSSGIFQKDVGSGAIFEASRILHLFHDQLREPYLTYNPGLILGGTDVTFEEKLSRGASFGKMNVVARSTVVKGDLRFLTPEQLAKTKQKMEAIVKESLPGTSAKIRFYDIYPSMPPTDGNREVLSRYSDASEDLGYGVVNASDPGERGAADTSFVAPYVNAIDGIGVLGDGAHTDRETIDLESLKIATARTAVLLYRLREIGR
jgi:glutamate carboxypeptidase